MSQEITFLIKVLFLVLSFETIPSFLEQKVFLTTTHF